MANQRGIGGFSKGRSGNPGGRPKAVKDLRELTRAFTLVAVNALAEIADNPKAPAAARVSAAQALLDRGYGRPPQAIATVASGLAAAREVVFRWLSESDELPINGNLIEHQ